MGNIQKKRKEALQIQLPPFTAINRFITKVTAKKSEAIIPSSKAIFLFDFINLIFNDLTFFKTKTHKVIEYCLCVFDLSMGSIAYCFANFSNSVLNFCISSINKP